MAEALKNQFGPDVPQAIARMVRAVYPAFATRAFLRDALAGYEALALMPRGRHIARALQRHLPADFPDAARILLASMDQRNGRNAANSMAGFLYLPHGRTIPPCWPTPRGAGERPRHATGPFRPAGAPDP